MNADISIAFTFSSYLEDENSVIHKMLADDTKGGSYIHHPKINSSYKGENALHSILFLSGSAEPRLGAGNSIVRGKSSFYVI